MRRDRSGREEEQLGSLGHMGSIGAYGAAWGGLGRFTVFEYIVGGWSGDGVGWRKGDGGGR